MVDRPVDGHGQIRIRPSAPTRVLFSRNSEGEDHGTQQRSRRFITGIALTTTVVDLAPVNLYLTAVPGASKLRGNLLCAVVQRAVSGD
jgi:hypothetical protein